MRFERQPRTSALTEVAAREPRWEVALRVPVLGRAECSLPLVEKGVEMIEPEFFVGVDEGGELHRVVVVDGIGQLVAERACAHQGAELRLLVDWLEQRVGDLSKVIVGIESPRGGVVTALRSAGVVVYSINPKQLDRFRDRFSASGSKDDRKDGLVAADALRTDRRHFSLVEDDPPQVEELRELTRLRRRLVKQKTQLANQLRAVLHEYWPELLSLCPGAEEPWLWALLGKAARPEQARKLQKKTLRQLLRQHRIRRFEEHELHRVLQQPAIPASAGTLRAAEYNTGVLTQQLELIHRQVKDVEKQIDKTLALVIDRESEEGGATGPGDAEIVLSLPGAGRLVAATLIGEASRLLRDYQRMRCCAGVAPVTRQSGKMHYVHLRWACDRQLRDIMVHWARNAVIKDAHLRARYQELRKRGQGHYRALRQVSDRLLRILAAMLDSRSLYNPDLHTTAQDAA